MNLSNHARCRMNQRAISNDVLETVLSLGILKRAKGGAERIFFGKKQSQEAIHCYHRSIPDPPKGFIVTHLEKYMS